MRVLVIAPPHTEAFGAGRSLEPGEYLGRLAEHLAAAEAIGAQSAIVYDFPSSLEPWVVAADVLAHSSVLTPIVAVHPYGEAPSVIARRVRDLRYRFGRQPHLNVVAGATKTARVAMAAPEDRVAARRMLAEWVAEFRQQDNVSRIYSPASSLAAAVPCEPDATLVMAKPRETLAAEFAELRPAGERSFALLVGVVARPTREEAWEHAIARFTGDRRQELATKMFRRDSVSSQHERNYAIAAQEDKLHDECLWYGASATGIDCPKLVGSYAEVAQALHAYAELGAAELVIDLPHDPAEYQHIAQALRPVSRI